MLYEVITQRLVFDEVLEAALGTTASRMGVLCLLDTHTGAWRMVAHRGFRKPWLRFWEGCEFLPGACGRAVTDAKRVIVEDIERSPIFAGTPALPVFLKAGVRAMQATPLISRSGVLLGVIATHAATPGRPEKRSRNNFV